MFRVNVCAICAAVSLTWISIIVLRLFNFYISDIILAVLMGESITGIMYLFENSARKKGKNSMLWLKVVIIILGTLLVYLFITQGFSSATISTLAVSILLVVIIAVKFRSKKNENLPKKYGRFQKEIKKLEEKFENCCD